MTPPLQTAKQRHRSSDPLADIPHYLGIFVSFIGVRLYLVFALALLAALAEGVGIMMLIPLLHSLDGAGAGEETGVGAALRSVLDWMGLGGSTTAILLVIAAFMMLKGGVLFLANGYKAYLNAKLMRELKQQLYQEFSLMRLQYYNSRSTGYFVNIINTQINAFLRTFHNMLQLGKDFVMTVVYFGVALVVAWRFGLMAIAAGLVILLLFRKLNIYVRTLSRRHSEEDGVLAKLLIQSLQSFKYLTSTGQQPKLKAGIMASIRRLSRQTFRMELAEAFTQAVREPLIIVMILIIITAQLLWLNQPLGPILVSILLFYRGLGSTLALQKSWLRALSTMGSVEMVKNEFATQAQEREPDGVVEIGPLRKGIEIQDVYFSYDKSKGDVLKGVTLNIEANTSVAIVGESGSGKSTLVDLLTLMLKPARGRVFVDGVPAADIRLSTWREQIGYVSQETIIFDDTIANNICLWHGDINSDPVFFERVREAARGAHIDHVIEALPEGYHTMVGDRGVRLSGGQRQRLFVARELFKRPSLLILDEATSALDSESERAIQESIDALKGRMTVVIIAHRLATIRNVDRVCVLHNGELVEEGSYADLREEKQSRFARLVSMQQL